MRFITACLPRPAGRSAERRAARHVLCLGPRFALCCLLTGCAKPQYTMSAPDNLAMLKAIKEDTVPPVAGYIEKGMNPDSADASGRPFMVTAARAGNSDLVYTFLRSGASVGIADTSGETALIAGTISNHSDIATMLLDRKANPNLAVTSGPNQGMTALLFAAEHGNADILLKLLSRGAEPNAQDAKGRTALMLAAASGHEQAVEALLTAPPGSKAADVTLKDSSGRTALQYAARKRNAAIIARLKQAGAKE